MMLSVIFIVHRLFEIVEFASLHAFLKLCHVVLSFAFAVHLLLVVPLIAVPSMALLAGGNDFKVRLCLVHTSR